MSTESDRWARDAETRLMPLNSRRVMMLALRLVTAGLGLPMSAPGDDLCQMIDGHLEGEARKPRDVQVDVERGTTEAEGIRRVASRW